MSKLLVPFEVDELLRYKPGRAERLARRGQLPHVKLPNGEIRFDQDQITALIKQSRVDSVFQHAPKTAVG